MLGHYDDEPADGGWWTDAGDLPADAATPAPVNTVGTTPPVVDVGTALGALAKQASDLAGGATPATPATPTSTSTSPLSSCAWKHSDSRGLAQGIAAALARARVGDWSAQSAWGSPGIADARALVAATLIMIDWLSTRDPVLVGDTLTIGERGDAEFTDPTRLKFATALQLTWQIARKQAAEMGQTVAADDSAVAISTIGANAPTVMLGKAAGVVFAWPAAVAVAATVGSVAWIWTTVSTNNCTLVLAKERTARMLATQGRMLELLGAHRQREKDAGGARLPWTQEEIDAFAALQTSQTAAYAGDAQHDRDMPRGGVLGGLLGDDKPGTALAAVSSGIGMIALAIVAYAMVAASKG